MVFALFAVLAITAQESQFVPVAQMTAQECPPPSFDEDRGNIGGRAIMADDGSRIVVQCGDGVIRFWRSGSASFVAIGRMPLFRAAKERGIVSADVLCPWPSLIRDDTKIEADCDVIDHDSAGGVYVLQTPGSPDAFLVTGSTILRESTAWQIFGGLRYADGQAVGMYVVDGQKRPELLEIMPLGEGRPSTVAQLPSSRSVIENQEGSACDVLYSTAYRSVIVSFCGAFRATRDMTYLRAFSENGQERWAIKENLSVQEDRPIVGDSAKAMVFSSGRYALVGKTSDRSTVQIIDLKTGEAAMRLSGWPIAAARNAAILLLKDEQGTLSLVKANISVGLSISPRP